MAHIIVIRPGCTDYDDQHRVQGSLDLPLNERGREQVDALVAQLAETPLDVIYAPPTEPALSTATAIGDSLGIPVKENEELRNLDQGLWQGLTVEEIRRKFPRVYKQWQESPESICPPEGETVDQAMKRVRKMLLKPLRKRDAIAIVASEPLATLVTCVVTGCRPGFSRTYDSEKPPCIEWLEVTELPELDRVAVAAGANGSPSLNGSGGRTE
jgi:probable phosphoglycerate mutase